MNNNNSSLNNRKLTKENVLISTNGGIDFYKFVIPKLKPGQTKCNNVKNPFYKDTRASLSIYLYNEKWCFKDFGEPAYFGDVFNFAAHFYKLDIKKDFYKILQKINSDIELNLEEGANRPADPSFTFKSEEPLDNQYYVYYNDTISKESLSFWEQFGISQNTLDWFRVKQVNSYKLIKPLRAEFEFKGNNTFPIFAYEISERCIKLYKPCDRDFKFQFIGDKPEKFLFGWDSVNSVEPDGEPIFITGGEKDVMTLFELGFHAFSLNSETAVIPEYLIQNKRFALGPIMVLYDIDETGVESSQLLCDNFGLNRIVLPKKLSEAGGKDVSDWVKLGFSKEELTELLHEGAKRSETDNNSSETNSSDESKNNHQEKREFNAITFHDQGTNEDFPLIPDEVFNQLPDFLDKCCQNFSNKRERDVFLYSVLGVISGCLPKVYGYYDRSKIFSNLYLFIVAPPASNKSVAKWAHYLGLDIHDTLISNYTTDLQNYSDELDEYNTHKNDPEFDMVKPEKPERKMLFIPANSSATAFLQAIAGNNERGILFETEADTLGDTLAHDWGNYSNSLRKAFHHEQFSYLRRLNNEYVEVRLPKLSVVLSGTPGQIKSLISDVENGLFSRFIFYYFEEKPFFKNVFSEKDSSLFEKRFNDYKEDLNTLFVQLEYGSNEIYFSLNIEQEKIFNTKFSEWLDDFVSRWGDYSGASIKRLGIFSTGYKPYRQIEDFDTTFLSC